MRPWNKASGPKVRGCAPSWPKWYLMNGWNGLITHPPVYRALTQRPQLDGYLVEVMVTETAKGMAQKMGADRILLIDQGRDHSCP